MSKQFVLKADAPAQQFALKFAAPKELPYVDKPLGSNISALAIAGRTLFCAADETSTVERLIYDPAKKEFQSHANFPLGNAFALPGGPTGEMDIEGLAVSGGFLWITGSHSLKRDSPDEIDPKVADLDDIDWDPNRGFLGCVPLDDHGDGLYEPVAAIDPVRGGDARKAAMMKMGRNGRQNVRRLLGSDPLLKPFMNVPCKENGFDIEGLAVTGNRVLLGLRGPVVGTYAMIVEMQLKVSKKGWLKPAKLADGTRYRLHAVDLAGLGIRDLLVVDDDLLILAGPTQDIEGIQRVFSVPLGDLSGVIPRTAIQVVRTLELLDGHDHAEGIAVFEADGKKLLLVSHDSPAPARYSEARNRLLLDAFAFK